MSQFIFLRGNVSEGFQAVGPYPTFSECCHQNDAVEGWVMELHKSGEDND